MKLKNIAILSGILFWPISLFVNNTLGDFIKYILPIFEPKLAILPATFISLYMLYTRKVGKFLFLLLLASYLLLATNYKSFWGQTIFKPDYEAQQAVIRQTLLYPNPLSARIFHNKVRIYIDKFNSNLFALTDPNNYFFRFHPRQITVDNQNLKKFPSLAIFPMLIGLYYINKIKYKKQILAFLIAGILSLSVLTVFDRNDFILWFPISAVFIHGINQLNAKKYSSVFFVVFIVFSGLELMQILV